MERNEPEHILVKLEKETYTVREDISAINCYSKEMRTTLIKSWLSPPLSKPSLTLQRWPISKSLTSLRTTRIFPQEMVSCIRRILKRYCLILAASPTRNLLFLPK